MKLSIEHSFEGDQHSVTIRTDEAQGKDAVGRFAFSLSSEDRERLRWYWEDFLHYPIEEASDEAQEAERRINDIGTDLFGKIFSSGAARTLGERSSRSWLRPVSRSQHRLRKEAATFPGS